MSIIERIRQLSVLPQRFDAMLVQALRVVKDDGQCEELCMMAYVISSAAWQHWLAWRPREDNRQEHEWVVFANIMKIAECETLSLSERRVATAFAFTHDSFYIPRIMEVEIERRYNEASKCEKTDPHRAQELRREAAELEEQKKQQRTEHMVGGANNARYLLTQLKHPFALATSLLTQQEASLCVEIIRRHDEWKTGAAHPLGSDRLAVVCLEGDALWPLHPYGVLADLERPDGDGNTGDFSNPAEWREKLKESCQTLLKYRANWKGTPGENFVDRDSIFRTQEGHRLYREWRGFWGI